MSLIWISNFQPLPPWPSTITPSDVRPQTRFVLVARQPHGRDADKAMTRSIDSVHDAGGHHSSKAESAPASMLLTSTPLSPQTSPRRPRFQPLELDELDELQRQIERDLLKQWREGRKNIDQTPLPALDPGKVSEVIPYSPTEMVDVDSEMQSPSATLIASLEKSVSYSSPKSDPQQPFHNTTRIRVFSHHKEISPHSKPQYISSQQPLRIHVAKKAVGNTQPKERTFKSLSTLTSQSSESPACSSENPPCSENANKERGAKPENISTTQNSSQSTLFSSPVGAPFSSTPPQLMNRSGSKHFEDGQIVLTARASPINSLLIDSPLTHFEDDDEVAFVFQTIKNNSPSHSPSITYEYGQSRSSGRKKVSGMSRSSQNSSEKDAPRNQELSTSTSLSKSAPAPADTPDSAILSAAADGVLSVSPAPEAKTLATETLASLANQTHRPRMANHRRKPKKIEFQPEKKSSVHGQTRASTDNTPGVTVTLESCEMIPSGNGDQSAPDSTNGSHEDQLKPLIGGIKTFSSVESKTTSSSPTSVEPRRRSMPPRLGGGSTTDELHLKESPGLHEFLSSTPIKQTSQQPVRRRRSTVSAFISKIFSRSTRYSS